jgi:hypothetical protein
MHAQSHMMPQLIHLGQQGCLPVTYLLTYMAWVQAKHPAVKQVGASMGDGGNSLLQ